MFYWKSATGEEEVPFQDMPDHIVGTDIKVFILTSNKMDHQLYASHEFKVRACAVSASNFLSMKKDFLLQKELIILFDTVSLDAFEQAQLLEAIIGAPQKFVLPIPKDSDYKVLSFLNHLRAIVPTSQFIMHRFSLYDPNQDRRITARLHYIQATLAIEEDLVVSETALALCKQILEGSIDLDVAEKALLSKYEVKPDRYNHIRTRGLSEDLLAQVDADLFGVALADLFVYSDPLPNKLAQAQLKKLHRALFHLFPFGGKIRTINISKKNTTFLPWNCIKEELSSLLSSTQLERWKHISTSDAVVQLAYFMTEYNVIHPFSEGNGRLGREIARQLLSLSGHEVDWGVLPPKLFLSCMELSIWDTEPLETALKKSIYKEGGKS